MPRRKSIPEAMGLSALDLFSGLFGLIVLLYALAPLDDGYPEPFEQTIYFISIEVENREGHELGLSFTSNNTRYESWPKCSDDGPVRWVTCDPGLIEVAVEGEKPEKELWISVNKFHQEIIPDTPIKARVTTPDGNKTIELIRSDFYRKKTEI